MKKILLQLIISLNLFNFNQAFSQFYFDWVNQIGDKSIIPFAYDVGVDIKSDSIGNVYAVGSFMGTVDFDPGPNTFYMSSPNNSSTYIIKYKANGELIYAKAFISQSGSNESAQIQLDKYGNIYILGTFAWITDFDPGVGVHNVTPSGSGNPNGYICKLDNSGNFIWVKTFNANTGMCSPTTFEINSLGHIYIAGIYGGVTDFDPGMNIYLLTSTTFSTFVIKLDSIGNLVWCKDIATGCEPPSLAMDKLNNIYLTSCFKDSVDFDPGINASFLYSQGIQGTSLYICKFDSTGNYIWAKQIGNGNAYNNFSNSITCDTSNNVYFTGCFKDTMNFDPGVTNHIITAKGHSDMFISKFDSNGNFIWVKQMEGFSPTYSNSSGHDLYLDSLNNIYCTSYFGGSVDFDPGTNGHSLSSISNSGDIAICKFDNSGNFILAETIGGDKTDYANAIDMDKMGNLYITGYFKGACYFDPSAQINNLTAISGFDAFVLKWTPVNQTGIETSDIENKLIVYPNPSSGKFMFSNIEKNSKIKIYDVTGRLIYQTITQYTTETIDLSSNNKGVYFYKIYSDKKELQQGKLIVN